MVRSTDLSANDSKSGGSELRLAELVAALGLASYIGTGEPMDSVLRSCLLAVRLGDAFELSEAELADVYYLVLLRFAGCTAGSHTFSAAVGDELDFFAHVSALDYGNPMEILRFMFGYVGAGEPPLRRARSVASAMSLMMRKANELSAGHCEVAQNLAGRLGMSQQVRTGLGQVFERWDGRGAPAHLKGEDVALSVRVAQLAGDLEGVYRIGGLEAVVTAARKRSGGAYDPALVRLFCREAPRLYESLDLESLWEAVLDAEPGPRPKLSDDLLEIGTRAMADFVDLQSPYMVGHSSGVATLAAAAAQRCGLPESDVVETRRAAYLHDLGRVGISAGIWGKPGPLTEWEWERVRLHPYYTERILARSRPLARLGALGALHHERLDGSGYHRRLPALMLPPGARILAAADAYHAMTETRPHRPALSAEAAAGELRRQVNLGRLDGEAVNAVLAAAGHRVRSTRRQWAAGLSDREVEVLRLLARGLSNRQMAERLFISKQTVGHHIRHIYGKIGVSTRAAATVFAMQHNLLQDSDYQHSDT